MKVLSNSIFGGPSNRDRILDILDKAERYIFLCPGAFFSSLSLNIIIMRFFFSKSYYLLFLLLYM